MVRATIIAQVLEARELNFKRSNRAIGTLWGATVEVETEAEKLNPAKIEYSPIQPTKKALH
jgi:hypothetical protein